MGLSGSGKSTLLRTANGLNPVTRGQVLVARRRGSDRRRPLRRGDLRRLRRERIAMVFQQFGLLPWRTVARERRARPGTARRAAGGAAAHRRREARAGRPRRSGRTARVSELSGGMQQRVGPRARVRDRRRHPADGRAVLGARPADPRQAAGRAAGAAGAREEDHPVRQPRPRRGAAARRPHLDHGKAGASCRPARPGHRAAPGGRLRRRVRAPHEPAQGADRRDGHARATSCWTVRTTACSSTPRAAIASGSMRAGRRPRFRWTGPRTRCAPWTTTTPARRASAASSSRRPRSRCRP